MKSANILGYVKGFPFMEQPFLHENIKLLGPIADRKGSFLRAIRLVQPSGLLTRSMTGGKGKARVQFCILKLFAQGCLQIRWPSTSKACSRQFAGC